jgi:hypothetical protein
MLERKHANAGVHADVTAVRERKQIEMLSGGYYEPILVALPRCVKISRKPA